MISPCLSNLTTWAYLLMLTTANPLFAETNGKYTMYKRQLSSVDPLVARDDTYSWPFPANQSSILDQASEPKNNPPQDMNVTAQPVGTTTDGSIPRKFIETKCDAGKKYKISEAWKEAKLLADAQTTFRGGYNFDIPHTQWLGKDWNSESSWRPWRWNFRKLIQDNFGRLRRLYSQNDAPNHEYVYWYCYDYGNQCTEGVQAYSWDRLGFFWSNHYTVFCDPFYNRMTLGDQIEWHANSIYEQKVMENFQLNRGQIMFHETWHYKDLVSSPRTDDYAYRAKDVWDMAKDKKRGTNYAYVNADSYALDAVAIYVQQYYKSSMSPVPYKYLASIDAEAAAATSEPPDDNAQTKTFTGLPDGWTGPLSDTDNPDLVVWEEITDDKAPPPPPAAKLTCTGIDNTKWMVRDALGDAINRFCGEAEAQGVQDKDSGSLTRNYNQGGPDQVTLSIDWPSGSTTFKPRKDECVGYITPVMDDCDGDNAGNPMNWKHGGSNQVGDVRYDVFPTAERYLAGICSMHVAEEDEFSGVDGPGTERQHTFLISVDAKDGKGKSFAGTGNNMVEAGAGNPYQIEGFYAPLEITPEAQNSYIQFTDGGQSWTTAKGDGVPRCQVGDWDGEYSPVTRNMDCFFYC